VVWVVVGLLAGLAPVLGGVGRALASGLPTIGAGLVGLTGGALVAGARQAVGVAGLGGAIGSAMAGFPVALGSMLAVLIDHLIMLIRSIVGISLGIIERLWFYAGEDPVKFIMLAVNLAILMS
jgi:hypothetical protein